MGWREKGRRWAGTKLRFKAGVSSHMFHTQHGFSKTPLLHPTHYNKLLFLGFLQQYLWPQIFRENIRTNIFRPKNDQNIWQKKIKKYATEIIYKNIWQNMSKNIWRQYFKISSTTNISTKICGQKIGPTCFDQRYFDEQMFRSEIFLVQSWEASTELGC